jgi:excinuclease ABC subunit B
MYASRITRSMQETIDQTLYRRSRQMAYNEENGIVPTAISKQSSSTFGDSPTPISKTAYVEPDSVNLAADPVVRYMTTDALQKALEKTKSAMKRAAKELDFLEAARLRDEMLEYEKLLKAKEGQ